MTGAKRMNGDYILRIKVNLPKQVAPNLQIGRAHVWTPVTPISRMPSSAWKKKKKDKNKNKNTKKKKIVKSEEEYNL